jgi:uncharacterized membrane protein YfcA
MMTVALLLLRGRAGPAEPDSPPRRPRLWLLALYGLLTGFLTGFLGAGGGFLIVPVLILAGGLRVHEAIGTSLLVITLNCGAGLAGFVGKVPIHWLLATTFALASTLGSLVGTRLAVRIDAGRLRRGFAVFVLLAGLAIFVEKMLEAGGI